MECCGRRRIPLVLDELPYLQHSVPGIDSLLQHAWDGHEGAVKLFLTGSSFSVMDAAGADPRAPLYGRRTAQLEVQPMSFDEVADFRPDWSFERRAVAYGLFGGVPAYAEQVARQESPVEAAHALALSPDGPLYAEPEFLVREELRDPGAYFAILHSPAAGKTRPNEIARDAGIPHASVGKYLDTLRRLRLVRRETPVTESRPERSRRSLYRLADPFLRFWFRYVYPNRSALEAGRSRQALESIVLPDLDTFMGRQERHGRRPGRSGEERDLDQQADDERPVRELQQLQVRFDAGEVGLYLGAQRGDRAFEVQLRDEILAAGDGPGRRLRQRIVDVGGAERIVDFGDDLTHSRYDFRLATVPWRWPRPWHKKAGRGSPPPARKNGSTVS